MRYKVASLFSGAGGLDLGFQQSGFDIVYANEKDKNIWETYELNHPNTYLDRRSITDVKSEDIPNVDGIIGGPPCQSWSAGGSKRGIEDPRGQLFFDFIRILQEKQPMFFLAENVSGMLAKRHEESLENIINLLDTAGYNIFFSTLNASDYGIAQDRKRVIFIGFRKDLEVDYRFPLPIDDKKYLKDIILDLSENAKPALNKSKPNADLAIANHEYMTGGFSSIYMSRNRVRSWYEPSFTIQASGRQAPIHPSASKMIKIGEDRFDFVPNDKYRRMSIRESARIQGFPDDFIFKYDDLNNGYKMIGNAVNVQFSQILANSIEEALSKNQKKSNV